MEYVLVTVVLVIIVFLCWRIKAQDKIIKELTDKLMARSYTEYVSMTKARDAPIEEISTRKPMSWYDDPNLPDVGDKT